MENNIFITKFRPTTFDEVLGQKQTVDSLKSLCKDITKMPHAFLLTGGSGMGKSTLGRILANQTNCSEHNLMEVDAGIYTGVDAMRTLIEGLCYAGFGESATKFIIIDECQKLSSASWDCLLKTIEEPPPHVYFCFCTTNPEKVPNTIKTRCHSYTLKPVDKNVIFEYLMVIAEVEDIKLTKECLEIIAEGCEGSPRKALVYLSQCRECKTPEEVSEFVEYGVENKEAYDLCVKFSRKASWKDVSTILVSLKSQSIAPETIRILLANYFTACVLKAKNDEEAVKFLTIVDKFSKPIFEYTGWTNLTLACGEVVFNV